MVIETGNPNFRAASCCNVEVVKGGEGDFFAGLVTRFSIEKSADLHFSRKLWASPSVLNFLGSSAFKTLPSPRSKNAVILKKMYLKNHRFHAPVQRPVGPRPTVPVQLKVHI